MFRVLNADYVRTQRNKVVALTPESIEKIVHDRLEDETVPDVGIDVHLYLVSKTLGDLGWIVFCVYAHASAGHLDDFTMTLCRGMAVPPMEKFECLVPIGSPHESYLDEMNNEVLYDEQQDQCATIGFTRPSMIRGLHYLGKELMESVGGLEKCLQIPAYKVKAFHEGVLIYLVEGLFDPENPDHLQAQRKAMEYLGLL